MKTGRLSDAEKKRIDELAATMKKPTPGKIARAIGRKPATVNWYMLNAGLIERKIGRAAKPYYRKGKWVFPYAAEHDRFLIANRPNLSLPQLAAAITERFGIARNHHSVHVRLVQLACDPDIEVA